MNILLYCGSRQGLHDVYTKAAEGLAREVVARGHGLVYGGGSIGLMGAAARAALNAGGSVIGVIPHFLAVEEVMLVDCTELIEVDSMHTRKLTMIERSDVIVALPGAYGTMDELFEAVTWLQLRLHSKPIGLLNVNGYYDALVAQFDRMLQEGFLTEKSRALIVVEDDHNRLLDRLLTRASTGVSARLERRS